MRSYEMPPFRTNPDERPPFRSIPTSDLSTGVASLHVSFRAVSPILVGAMLAEFDGVQNFDVTYADIFAAGAFDAVVSPANSHGWMDGGIDLLYLRRFGYGLQDRLLKHIHQLPSRKVLVGEALLVATGDALIPYMISAPTMEVPGPVPHSENAYLAFRAALRVARDAGFRRILCPGLATGTGRMHPTVSARQMRRAWDGHVTGPEARS